MTWLPIPVAVLVCLIAFGWEGWAACSIGIIACWLVLALEGYKRYGP